MGAGEVATDALGAGARRERGYFFGGVRVVDQDIFEPDDPVLRLGRLPGIIALKDIAAAAPAVDLQAEAVVGGEEQQRIFEIYTLFDFGNQPVEGRDILEAFARIVGVGVPFDSGSVAGLREARSCGEIRDDRPGNRRRTPYP